MILFTNDYMKDKDQLICLLEKEKIYMNSFLKFQQKLKESVLQCMQKFVDATDDIPSNCVNTILEYLENLKNSFNMVKENIALIENKLSIINDIILETTQNNCELDINKYDSNKLNVEEIILKNTIQIQDLLSSILKYSTLEFQSMDTKTSNSVDTPSQNHIQEENKTMTTFENVDKYQENTLIISELKGTVILPYKISELNETLQRYPEKFSTIEDIIQQLYTLPFSLYKNPSIARFREAFKLVHDREHKSVKSAFDLGMELLFNYNLHPAIISACKNIDELDIYLDYLENNETDKFDLFQIVFEIAPTIVKKKTNKKSPKC